MKKLINLLLPFVLCAAALSQVISGSGIVVSGTGVAMGPTSSSILSITTVSVPSASQGIAYTPFTFSATGGVPCGGPAYNWALAAGSGPLPTGFSLAANGQLTGTTLTSGVFPFTVQASDCGAHVTPKDFSITVSASSPIVIVNSSPLTAGTQGTPISVTFTATGGVPCGGPSYNWTQLSGTIPPGTSLSGAGTLNGTPSATGTFVFAIQAADCGGNTTPKTFSLTINSASAPGAGENAYCTGSTDDTCFTGGQVDTITEAGITVSAHLPVSGLNTDTTNTPAGGSTTTVGVASCTAIQNALNSASCGDHVQIPALNSGPQNTQTCNITLPNHSCDATHWIWLETDKLADPGFPAEHIRATPCAINVTSLAGYPSFPCASPAFLMPQIQCANSSGQSCIIAAPGANYYRIIGLELLQPSTYDNNGNGLVDLTAGSDHIVIDRSLLHGQPVGCTRAGSVYNCTSRDLKNGVQPQNSTNVAVINSWIYDVACARGTCTDSHAIGGGNGTSISKNYKIYNNLLSAAGENILQGGAGSVGSTIITPTDGEVRENHFIKPVQWFLCTGCSGTHAEPKNFFEVKNAQRWLFEGNVLENNIMGWQTDQSGYPINLDPRNQSNQLPAITVTSDGGGNLTATSGSFGTGSNSPVAPGCANSGHCQVTVAGVKTTTVSQTDATHIKVSPAPAAGSGLATTQCGPGLNPLATGLDIIVRFNDIRNSTNGIEVGTVLSDCGDAPLATANIVGHDNLLQGINSDLNNATGTNALARCMYKLNASPVTLHDVAFAHNTCLVSRSGNFGYSGLDVTQDLLDTTTTGSSGAYLSNMITTNNLGPGGGIFTYSSGLYPGGALAGLKQQSCIPPVTGGTCTWAYTHNVQGQGQWTSQINNTPFPTTNQICGSGSASCFPSGSAFTSIFTTYNGPNGQPGYLGNYQMAGGSPFINAGTDGKNLGADITRLNTLKTGVASTISYTPAAITTSTLAAGTSGTLYPTTQLAATSASDMQVWRTTTGSLPAGMSLSRAGQLSGTPTAAGSFAFTVQMMDAAQQYATRSYTLTIAAAGGGGGGGGGGGIANNWVQITTPVAATSIRDMAIIPTNGHFFIAAVNGFYKSTDSGGSWTLVNTGLSIGQGWNVTWDAADSQLIAGVTNASGQVKIYRSTNEGTSWTLIPQTQTCASSNSVPAFSGSTVAGSTLIDACRFGVTATCGAFWSTNAGVSTTNATCPVNGSAPAPGGAYSLFWSNITNDLWLGTEQAGIYHSSDNGHTYAPASGPDQNFGGVRNGNINSICEDSSGNKLFVSQGGLWKSSGTFPSMTWSNVVNNPNTSAGRLCFKDSNGAIYYGHTVDPTNTTTLVRSTTNGALGSFTSFSTGLPSSNMPEKIIEFPTGTLWLVLHGSGEGVYHTQ